MMYSTFRSIGVTLVQILSSVYAISRGDKDLWSRDMRNIAHRPKRTAMRLAMHLPGGRSVQKRTNSEGRMDV
jgi:hypothetical protein